MIGVCVRDTDQSFDEREGLFFGAKHFPYAKVCGAMYAVHAKSHQAVLVQRHVLLLIRVQNLYHFFQKTHLSIRVKIAHEITQLHQLLFGWTFVEIYHDWLHCCLHALITCLHIHRLFFRIRL